jgi:hypothetical protein
MKKDLLHICYDVAKVKPEQMLQEIEKLGYEGKVNADGDSASKT